VLILEYKVKPRKGQHAAIEAAIRTVQFIRNKCVQLWMDTWGTNQADLQAYSAQLAREFSFAALLNSMARQAAADRAWRLRHPRPPTRTPRPSRGSFHRFCDGS
jgi:putative transposase